MSEDTAKLELNPHSSSPEWLLKPETLATMPLPPHRIDMQDGVILVTERPPVTDPFTPKRERPLYEPTVPTVEREQELEALARIAGLPDVDGLLGPADMEQIKANVPPYLTRRFPEEPTVLDALREMRRSALEQLYAARVLSLGRQSIEDKLPTLLPQQPTVGLVEPDIGPLGEYHGRFGGVHYMQFKASNVRMEDIEALTTDSEEVSIAAHELLHQRHAEIQGATGIRADASPFNEITMDDPWEVRQLADQYWTESAESYDGTSLPERLCSHLTETIAYLGQAEIRGWLQHDPMYQDQDVRNGDSEEWQRTEHLWVDEFAGMAPLGERSQIIERLMHVDFREFAHLLDEEALELLENPAKILK